MKNRKKLYMSALLILSVYQPSARATQEIVVNEKNPEIIVCHDQESCEEDLFADDDGPEVVVPEMAPMTNLQKYACIAAMKAWMAWKVAHKYVTDMNQYLEKNLYSKVRKLF